MFGASLSLVAYVCRYYEKRKKRLESKKGRKGDSEYTVEFKDLTGTHNHDVYSAHHMYANSLLQY